MRLVELGIVYRFHADDDEHAVEQFIDALGFAGDELEAQHIRDSINVVRDME